MIRAYFFSAVFVVTAAGAAIAAEPAGNVRPPKDEADLRGWLENMVWYHGFSPDEVRGATGLPVEEIEAALAKWDIRKETRPRRGADAPLLVLPYPGGRHPRIGFLEGAIDPQRDTKASVFLPWAPEDYVVLDLPEAIWWDTAEGKELLYLAHTHIDTHWDKKGVQLEKLEWTRTDDGRLRFERRLPNGVVFGTELIPSRDAVRMTMWLTNGTNRKLTGLAVQNCIMTKAAPEFAAQTNDNKRFKAPVAACKSSKGNRWLITAWTPCHRCWGNEDCPCMHSDPKFPDCPRARPSGCGDGCRFMRGRMWGRRWSGWRGRWGERMKDEE